MEDQIYKDVHIHLYKNIYMAKYNRILQINSEIPNLCNSQRINNTAIGVLIEYLLSITRQLICQFYGREANDEYILDKI